MEAVVVATGRFLVDKVGILLQLDEKLKAMTDIKGKMERLKELLTIIDAVIEDVESRPSIDETAKDLLKKLKYFAYDLEDVVDYYDTDILRKQRSRASFKPVRDFFSSNNQVMFKCGMGVRIKAITKSLDSILLQKSILLNLSQPSIRMSELSRLRAAHSRSTFDVIGREPEKNMIVDMLTDDDESKHGTVRVISIVGMGGLGKTTLAQLVFNDERVKTHFASSRMWKVVGAEFDPTKILKSVLELATDKSVKISEIDLVRQNLEKTLTGKRFLLVLDDIWNEDALKWGVVKAALTCGARGSKILVTTRSQQISSIMDSSYSHRIKQLSRADCLSLFQQFAFGDKEVDQTLMEIGGKIIEKCGGVPLAAISLGSMLRNTRDETYWSSVLNSEIWQLGDGEQKVLAILKWSYDTLPPLSKKCFAFGSLFPKDFRMEKEYLIKLWMANGFVHSEGNFEAETVGNRVFDDLVMRSFFLLAPSHELDFGATECSMHDLMHDLARSVSADVYWNYEEDSVEDIGNRTYHLNLHGYLVNMLNINRALSALGKNPLYLRTLILNNCNLHQHCNQLEIILSKLKFLRVLDLSGSGIGKVPTSIGNLIHLRYLDLSGNSIEFLPDFITLLHNLQYFDCDYDRLTHMPCGLSRLTNLRSLPVFVASGRTGTCSITELEDLKLRGKMIIKISRNFTNYTCGGRKFLKNKHLDELSLQFNCLESNDKNISDDLSPNNLDELSLQFNCSESNDKEMLDDLCPNMSLKKLTINRYGSRQFPAWLIELQLPNLVEVNLVNCRGCEHMPPFGNLQSLKELVLNFMDGITHLNAEFHGYGGFPSLQKLCLDGMDNLEEWSESHGVRELFSKLQILKIFYCPKLKCMPRLPTIQRFEIFNFSGSLLSCIGRLTSLSVLKVNQMMDDMTSLPSGCIRNLTSLTELQIKRCARLQSLPWDELQYLKMIRSLTINRCPTIISHPEILVQILNSLHEFKVEICSKNVNLRGQLQHLDTLEELYITGADQAPWLFGSDYLRQLGICCCECDELESLMTAEPARSTAIEELVIDGISNLTTLPDWLRHLKSLRVLTIAHCSELGSLPRGLENLHMLETLTISGCPQLKRRCERETGEDWPIISHLPHVYIW